MIKDNLKNAYKYYSLSPAIDKALQYLENNNLEEFSDGSYPIDGDDIYMNVQEYETKISNNIESHRKYIDIQFMIRGQENIGVCGLDDIVPSSEYDEKKDVIFYNGEASLELLNENEFVIFYPEDAHLPCQMIDVPKIVKKVVVKIKI